MSGIWQLHFHHRTWNGRHLIILTGLSAVVAFRSGMFSIGQEGQYLLGAAAAAWLGYAIHLPPILHPLVLIIAAMLVGAGYGWIPGILKVKLGVNELLATIMLNSIAALIIEYLVQFPMRADQSTTAHSPVIDESAQLMSFLPGSKWGVGFVIAVMAVIVIYIYLWRTKPGYEQRMAGQSRKFALFGGIRSDQLSRPCNADQRRSRRAGRCHRSDGRSPQDHDRFLGRAGF